MYRRGRRSPLSKVRSTFYKSTVRDTRLVASLFARETDPTILATSIGKQTEKDLPFRNKFLIYTFEAILLFKKHKLRDENPWKKAIDSFSIFFRFTTG